MTLPTHELELRAADQRRRLHASVHELKDHVRDSLDVKKNARDHVLLASGVAAALAAAVGYGLAGMFTSR
jgi:predicted sugar kinase